MVSPIRLDDGLCEGTVIAEKYRLVSLLGEGGMGVVWAAEHLVTKRKVALKLLRPRVRTGRGRAKDERVRERALREARASVAVGDPRVLPIDDVLEHAGEAVLVMERLVGETLRVRMDRAPKLPYAEARPLLVALAEAMCAAHEKGVVHRDLKPDNVFLLAKPSAEVPLKVLDFGIAKLTAEVLDDLDTPLTTTGAMLGTPVYMSPEQGFGESDIDARSDAWSFGVLAYEMLAGTRPVRGDNLGQVLKAIAQGSRPSLEGHTDAPPAVCRAIDALLVSDRDKRGDLGNFLAAAAARTHAEPAASIVAGAGRTLAAVAIDPAERTSGHDLAPPASRASRARRSRAPLLAGLGLAGAVVAVAAFVVFVPRAAAPPPPAVVAAHDPSLASVPSASQSASASPVTPSPRVTPSASGVAGAKTAPRPDGSMHSAPKPNGSPVASAPTIGPAMGASASTRGAGGVVVNPPF